MGPGHDPKAEAERKSVESWAEVRIISISSRAFPVRTKRVSSHVYSAHAHYEVQLATLNYLYYSLHSCFSSRLFLSFTPQLVWADFFDVWGKYMARVKEWMSYSSTACFFFYFLQFPKVGVLRLILRLEEFWIAIFSSTRTWPCAVCFPPKFIVFEKREVAGGGRLTWRHRSSGKKSWLIVRPGVLMTNSFIFRCGVNGVCWQHWCIFWIGYIRNKRVVVSK